MFLSFVKGGLQDEYILGSTVSAGKDRCPYGEMSGKGKGGIRASVTYILVALSSYGGPNRG